MLAEVSRSLRLIPFKLELVFIQADSLLPCYTHRTRPVRPGRRKTAAEHVHRDFYRSRLPGATGATSLRRPPGLSRPTLEATLWATSERGDHACRLFNASEPEHRAVWIDGAEIRSRVEHGIGARLCERGSQGGGDSLRHRAVRVGETDREGALGRVFADRTRVDVLLHLLVDDVFQRYASAFACIKLMLLDQRRESWTRENCVKRLTERLWGAGDRIAASET